MEVFGLVDKRNILLLLGCYCNNPKLITDENYGANPNDFDETFHKTIFGAMYNIVKRSSVTKITPLEIENELSQFESALNLWKMNDGWAYIETAIDETEDKLYNIDLYFDTVRKFAILRMAKKMFNMDIGFIYDEKDEVKLEQFNRMSSKDVSSAFYTKFDEFKSLWKDSFSDNYSFHAGDNIKERIQMHKEQDSSFGYPFQSGYMTTIFRGMRPKKFMIRSSISGGGKTRSSLAEACNISSDRIYNWKTKEWVSTGAKQPVLFISTELTKEELQDCLLAHVSGIDEDRIAEWKEITPEEEEILLESAKVVEESLLFGEYLPDFTIDSIEETVERYCINENITHCFFDYINDSPSMYSYYIEKSGVRLQTHQILFLFSAALKQVCNKYNVYFGSATQLSSNWKEEKDANAIKGSKAIIEKADYGVISLPATPADLKKLEPILKNGFYETPTMAYHIYKNRGGRYSNVIVWTKMNMGCVREVDCFVTTTDYELITDIEKTAIEFQMEDVGECETYTGEGSTDEYIDQFNKVNINDD